MVYRRFIRECPEVSAMEGKGEVGRGRRTGVKQGALKIDSSFSIVRVQTRGGPERDSPSSRAVYPGKEP